MSGGFSRGLLKVFTATRRKLRTEEYLKRHYPRVYRFFVESIARGECPLCGFQLKSRLGLAPHLKSARCLSNWMAVMRSMAGRGKLSEDEVIDLVNRIREENGLPPARISKAKLVV